MEHDNNALSANDELTDQKYNKKLQILTVSFCIFLALAIGLFISVNSYYSSTVHMVSEQDIFAVADALAIDKNTYSGDSRYQRFRVLPEYVHESRKVTMPTKEELDNFGKSIGTQKNTQAK